MLAADLDLPALCGQLLVGGFDGDELPSRFEKALREGLRGGAILFRRNLPNLSAVVRVAEALRTVSPRDLPPFIGVDQEGGRVTRLPSPFLTLPPMRVLGAIGDTDLTRRAARAVGAELHAVGINLNFAPILDVDSNPQNPVIGDRSFGSDPETVARHGTAFIEGLQSAGVLACGKHFPGHGDTSVDSHLDLPIICHDRARLDCVEFVPFRAACASGVAAIMTAHVVVEALDPGVPATLSRAVCTDLLRGELGFRGVLFSDDLQMKAVAALATVEELSVGSVRAGCDVLLVCHDQDLQDRAHEALVREAERDRGFYERCVTAVTRGIAARRKAPPAPIAAPWALNEFIGGPDARAILAEIAAKQAAR